MKIAACSFPPNYYPETWIISRIQMFSYKDIALPACSHSGPPFPLSQGILQLGGMPLLWKWPSSFACSMGNSLSGMWGCFSEPFLARLPTLAKTCQICRPRGLQGVAVAREGGSLALFLTELFQAPTALGNRGSLQGRSHLSLQAVAMSSHALSLAQKCCLGIKA